MSDWKKVQKDQVKEAEEKKAKLIEEARGNYRSSLHIKIKFNTFFVSAREEERRLRAEKEQEVNSVLRSAQKQVSKEQKEARDKLMQQYGYVADGDEEEEEEEPSELTPRDRRRGKTLPTGGNK